MRCPTEACDSPPTYSVFLLNTRSIEVKTRLTHLSPKILAFHNVIIPPRPLHTKNKYKPHSVRNERSEVMSVQLQCIILHYLTATNKLARNIRYPELHRDTYKGHHKRQMSLKPTTQQKARACYFSR
jgi:hypothetical protein